MNATNSNLAQTQDDNPAGVATILLVDDEENILRSLRRLLKRQGYNILSATSGAEGLKILEETSVELVISDMRMPEMDGAEFLERVYDRWPKIVRILLTGFSDISSTIDAINRGKIYRYISKPWEDNDLIITISRALEQLYAEREKERLQKLINEQNRQLKELNANLDKKVAQRTAELKQTTRMVEVAYDTLKKSYGASIKVFSNLIEMREGKFTGHSRRVASTALEIAKKLELDSGYRQSIVYAALLHDIGKIGLPDIILNRPFNVLTPEERLKVVKHPIIGEGLLMALEPLQEAAKIIRSHHEQYDGKGYPDGLQGENIPIGARILAVASDYDALQIGTIATQKLSGVQAQEAIKRASNRKYDPKVVKAFLSSIGIILEKYSQDTGNRVKSNALAIGMVLAKDVVTPDGVLILSEGYILDSNLIERIQQFEASMDAELDIFIKKGTANTKK